MGKGKSQKVAPKEQSDAEADQAAGEAGGKKGKKGGKGKAERDMKIQFEFQEKAIRMLKAGIEELEESNQELFTGADSPYAQIEKSFNQLRQMNQNLMDIKEHNELTESTCHEIKEQLKVTKQRLSNSMTRLNELVDITKMEGNNINQDIDELRLEIKNKQQKLEHEIEMNQKGINEEIEILSKKLETALNLAKNDMNKGCCKCCCTIL